MPALTTNCPSCKKTTLKIEKNRIFCEESDCDFQICYCCPICNEDLSDDVFANDDTFKCSNCGRVISVNRMAYLINNQMVVDHESKCQYCHGPTVHRREMNLGNRCFFYPKCSGQVDLFEFEKESFTFLDFETTGLDIGKDAIIEIGALKIDENGEEHIYQTLVNPAKDISQIITNITGITADMVKESPDLKKSCASLIDFIGDSKIVVHNAEFDIPWLMTSILRHQISYQNNEVICTLKWARSSEEAHCSLAALTRKYKIPHSNAHRALADAAVTKELFFIFSELAKAKRPQQHLNDFLEMASRLVEKHKDFVQA